MALNLIKSLLASAEVKASAVLGHDAIVKRMSTIAALYEKRTLEQQTAKAEMGALEQLFELSRLSGEGGVERQALEDRAELLHETIASAVALEPPPKTPKAEKVAKLRPSAGAVSKAEPPPEIRQSTKSSALKPWHKAIMCSDAFSPASSGTGCDASTTSMRCATPAGRGGVWW